MPSTNNNGTAQQDQDDYWRTVNLIAKQVRQKRCILFLGSAIHSKPPTAGKEVDHKYPLTGPKLSQMLANKSGYPEEDHDNLQRVSWYYEWKYHFRGLLVDEVRNAVHTGREPSAVLRALARLDFPLVITTNYDQLYEQALDQVAQERARALGRPDNEVENVRAQLVKCVYSSDRVVTKDCDMEPSSTRPYLLKIHGDIIDEKSLVITDEDYIQFVLRMTDKPKYKPIGERMLTHLAKRTTLFIGYSLRDYNLRLLFKSLRWGLDDAQVPPTYSVDFEPDVLIRDVWQERRRHVQFIEKNLWEFVPHLYKAVTNEDMPQ